MQRAASGWVSSHIDLGGLILSAGHRTMAVVRFNRAFPRDRGGKGGHIECCARGLSAQKVPLCLIVMRRFLPFWRAC